MKLKVDKLNKNDLDLLSEQEIENHRYKYLTSITHNNWHGTEEKQYIEELELYTNIRFKQNVLDRFQRWRTDNDPDVRHLFEKIPDDVLYLLRFQGFKEDWGEPKFILGLELPIT